MTAPREMESALEAVLFVSGEPVQRDKLLEIFADNERERAVEALDVVLERYRAEAERGVLVEEVAGGIRLVTRPELNGYLRRFFEVTGRSKLSMAALETLAIVAYRQPITGPEVQELRGVSAAGVLKTLLERRLVRITGRKEVVGKPFLYGTTREFLMHFGLQSLDELPPLEAFEEALGLERSDGESEGAEMDRIDEVAWSEAGPSARAEPEGDDGSAAESAAVEPKEGGPEAPASGVGQAEDAQTEEARSEEAHPERNGTEDV